MHDVGSFEVGKWMFRFIFTVSDFIVQFGALQGTDVGGVAVGNRNAARFEKFLRSVQTLGTELVVPEAAEELGHEDVRVILRRRVPVPHVRADDGDLVAPELQLLVLQRDHRVRILLHGEHADLAPRGRGGLQRGADERPAARTHHDQHQLAGVQLSLGHQVHQRGPHGGAVLGILHGVLLKHFVGLGLEVVHKWLQRTLEIVLVTSGELLQGVSDGDLLVEVVQVLLIELHLVSARSAANYDLQK